MSQGNPHPTPFKKTGADANPNGRPKMAWKVVFEKELEKTLIDRTGKKEVIKQLVARAQIAEALKGDTQAFNAIADRMEGRPFQPTDITSDGERIDGIQVTIVEAKTGPENE